MKYLVTGGAGFIGSHLVDALLSEEHEVIVIDDYSFGNEENLIQHKSNKNLRIYRKSVCDDLKAIFENNKFDAVFHLAANPQVQYTIKNPIETHKVNVDGTLNVLNMCRKYNVKKFIFSSSAAVYGDSEEMPLFENQKLNPLSPYALHKIICEQYCNLFYKLYGVETICLRYFNVYGKRQDPNNPYSGVISKFIKKLKNSEDIEIYGNGKQKRDFVHVLDVVNANIAALKCENLECFGNVFNIGTGKEVSINELSEILMNKIHSNSKIIHSKPVIEPKHSRADISKAKKLLNWEPKVTFEEGISELILS